MISFDGAECTEDWIAVPTKKCCTCGSDMTLEYSLIEDTGKAFRPVRWCCNRQGHGNHYHSFTEQDTVVLTLTGWL